MEDGEVQETASGVQYHPSLEFPSDDSWLPTPSSHAVDSAYRFAYAGEENINTHATVSAASSSGTATSNIPIFRLVVLNSDILPPAHTLALLDGHTQVEFGRDAPQTGSTTPRVRLKEMEVSKLHATAFWDATRREWAVVDMGSKHGTFVGSPTTSPRIQTAEAQGPGRDKDDETDSRGQRLSPPRVSSVPRRLQYLDELSIGTTTFAIHIHDGIPCALCSPKGGDEIPLFHDKKGRSDEVARKRKRQLEAASTGLVTPDERDPRKALTMLKRSLLLQHRPLGATGETKTEYVDRSAKRRALQTGLLDVPGIDPRSAGSSPATSVASSSRAITPSPPVSAPPTPLPSNNIGHKLLMKQGWQPGSTLGVTTDNPVEGSIALVEPLEAIPRSDRAGLGASSQSVAFTSSVSWKDEGKLRRWSDLNAEGG